MAGTLPGVECARRRRCRQNSLRSDSAPIAAAAAPALTRRSVLCLYTSNHETLLASNLTLQRSLLVEAQEEEEEDDKLDGVAREAKRRLDQRFRSQRKSQKDKKVELDRDELDRCGTKLWSVLGLKST